MRARAESEKKVLRKLEGKDEHESYAAEREHVERERKFFKTMEKELGIIFDSISGRFLFTIIEMFFAFAHVQQTGFPSAMMLLSEAFVQLGSPGSCFMLCLRALSEKMTRKSLMQTRNSPNLPAKSTQHLPISKVQ
jgi:hypothetical protein